MHTVSVFADESGGCDSEPKLYLLALLFHGQAFDIVRPVGLHEWTLEKESLLDTLLDAPSLMIGYDAYDYLDV